MESHFITLAKEHVTKHSSDLHALQSLFHTIQHEDLVTQKIDWSYIFQKVYLHACLHGHRDTAKWLRDTFEASADPISKIAYRQTYAYANVLLKKKGKEPL
jgi:hypothetical protein